MYGTDTTTDEHDGEKMEAASSKTMGCSPALLMANAMIDESGSGGKFRTRALSWLRTAWDLNVPMLY